MIAIDKAITRFLPKIYIIGPNRGSWIEVSTTIDEMDHYCVFIRLILSILLMGSSNSKLIDKQWWETALIYQIWPRGFQDSDGNGEGDLKGTL